MRNCPSFILTLFLVVFSLLVSPKVYAGLPDGAGPWADFVATSSQANTKGGQPVSVVNPLRSNPLSAVGVAENSTVDSTFFSLGFGGSITLGFDNPVSGGVIVVEATNPDYPLEKAHVEVSKDGTTWVSAGSVVQDGQVSMPQSVKCAKYVRITDTSNPNDFSEDTADGYDVDGVQTQHTLPCDPGAETEVVITETTTCIVSQQNTTVTNTSVTNKAQTGNNIIKKSTGKSTVKTGTSKAYTTVKIKGGTTTAATLCTTCKGSTTVAIEGT